MDVIASTIRFWVPILVAALASTACSIADPPPPPCSDITCRYATAISEADLKLADFGGVNAANVYEQAYNIAQASLTDTTLAAPLDTCRPLYGQLLGHTQEILKVINGPLAAAIDAFLALGDNGNNSGGGLFKAGLALAKLRAAQDSGLFEFDLGRSILNFYDANFREHMERIVEIGAELETMPDCVFLANADAAPNQFQEPGVPFRLLTNDSIAETLANNPDALALELRWGQRWDLVEARFLVLLTELARGLLFYVIGHDISVDDQQMAQALLFAQRLVLNVIECQTAGSLFFGEAIDPEVEQSVPADERGPVDGEVDSAAECQAWANNRDLEAQAFSNILRDLGFLGDNPKTLARHQILDDAGEVVTAQSRWNVYMLDVDNRLANAFRNASPIFSDMIVRTVRHGADANQSARLQEYALAFDDVNGSGAVDVGDLISLDIESVKIAISDSLAESLGFGDAEGLEQAVELALSTFLQLRVSSDDLVTSIQAVVDNLAAQFSAVEDASITPEPFRISDLQPILAATSLFGDDAIPDALQLNFTEFLREGTNSPKPLREMLPYWEAVTRFNTQGQMEWINQFIIEEEVAPGEVTGGFSWRVSGDTGHFRAGGYTALDPTIGIQPVGDAAVPVPGANIPADFWSPEDNGGATLLYLYFQDPSFGGLVQTKTAGLANVDPHPGDSNTFVTPDLWQLHRAMIAYLRWFDDNFLLAQLLGG